MDELPNRVAIIGAGPAGFYTAEALLKREVPVAIDLYNRLPTPYGLVRHGVAPDHEPIKSVTRIYQRLLQRSEVRYLGNVTLGQDLEVEELRRHYHQIVYAFGAQSDRSLGIPGEDLEGSWAATTFVGWYNGHPDFRAVHFDLNTERVVVVGNGNVAIDVARILVLSPETLAKTDIADHALAVLRKSKVRDVTLLGRRGPAQAAFTNPELKEFGRLEGVSVDVESADLELDPASQSLVDGDRGRTRNMNTLREFADQVSVPGNRTVRFRFLVSPTEILGQDGAVIGIRAERNELVPSKDGSMRPKGSGDTQVLDCGMVFRSVGYRGEPVEGVPHDPRYGIVPNVDGRVTGDDGRPRTGEYVVGWAKRGPSGVIGTNKADASATVASMIEDLEAGATIQAGPVGNDPRALLEKRGIRWIDENDWTKLENFETARGEAQGRPRVKLSAVPEMLDVIDGSPTLETPSDL